MNESKKPFQLKNTRKVDAIREAIDNLKLSWTDKCVLLASLIYAMDTVDNTLGHYASYLSKWSSRSFNDITLKLPKRFSHSKQHKVVKGDISNIIQSQEYDLAYFDPPYGSNNEKMPPSRVRYAAYYHIWTSIIRNDRPKLFGKANRREDTRDQTASSIFEEFRKDEKGNYLALQAIHNIIHKVNARYVLLSYSSGGRATKDELYDIIQSTGRLHTILEIDYKKNVMASMKWTDNWTNQDDKLHEYLFLMEKT